MMPLGGFKEPVTSYHDHPTVLQIWEKCPKSDVVREAEHVDFENKRNRKFEY
jgi:hypothetical protein